MKRLAGLWMILTVGALATCSGPSPSSSTSQETAETARAIAKTSSLKSTPTDTVADRPGYDWPQWRGLRQDGISLESGLLSEWPEGGPPELWRVELGNGYSSLAVVGNRAYTMFGDDEGEYVVCIDVTNGEPVWQVRSDGPFKNSYGGRTTRDADRSRRPCVHRGRDGRRLMP